MSPAVVWGALGLLGGVVLGHMVGYQSGVSAIGDALSPMSDDEREELLRRIGKGRPAKVVKLVKPPAPEPAPPAPEPDPAPDTGEAPAP